MTDATARPTEAPEIEFVAPLMGLGGHTRYTLVSLDADGTLYTLRSVSDPDLRLIVVAPGRFFPDYAPEIDDETVDALQIEGASDAAVLCVVNPGEDPATATVNLLAPLVINHRSLKAAQTVLGDRDLPLKAPLLTA
ncbi:flagellar assembly protein FliW [Kineococcus gynurae]|uniref:Flagellar assembly factor FliW n=1 Tax=Kineococcus gynurae TaxID=452979 RepID=A0ABV5LXF9_9ACTN